MVFLRMIVVAALGLSLAGCAAQKPSSPAPSAAEPTAEATLLITALLRVVAQDATSQHGSFADMDALRSIGGEWTDYIRYGADDLFTIERLHPGWSGISLAQARYAITVSQGADKVIVLAGGQDAAKVATTLTSKGWTAEGDLLAMPQSDEATDHRLLRLHLVRAVGDDVLVGSDKATLKGGATDRAKSLAAHPLVGSFADCLGAVVLGEYSDGNGGNAAAVGVLRPSPDGKIRSVVCSRFDSAAAATQAAEEQRSAYATGTSRQSGNKPYSTWYQDADVKVTGQMVRVEVTVTRPDLTLVALAQRDLPGLDG